MALKKVKGTLERVMEKNLQDLVRGIRNHKETEAKYIAECIDEIKSELRQDNQAVKANAVAKLTYLQMLGYDVSWAAFNIIEVMSAQKFTYKRVGYLAASQSFHEGTDVLMLTTNMIRKDLGSHSMYDAGVALNGLSCFLTADLARDLANDIMTLMTSTKPYLRKKAVLIMYKVFLKFPEALRPAFPRLKEKLEDPDPGVQSAAVNVICELARKNPKNYLSLAPLFFKLMTSSTNNWVLIKIIKLFGALTPLEPRLGKKLIEPLTNLIHSGGNVANGTSAMSLLYECINTVIAGIPNHSASIQLCVQKLRILIEDSDQNLKYLGLLAMSRILKTHPKSVQSHKDLIMCCLDDKDDSIRLRALDLLYGMIVIKSVSIATLVRWSKEVMALPGIDMQVFSAHSTWSASSLKLAKVSKKNLMEIVKKLMIHMDKAEGSHYRDELLSKIIEICSQSNYQYITNFEWYVSILVELTRLEGTRHGKQIANQMLDVAIRVQAIRPFAVSQMAVLLENSHLFATNSQKDGICEVLYAAAWICGEFSEHLQDPRASLEAMLRPKVTALPGHIQSVFVQNIVKLYSRLLVKAELECDADTVREAGQLLIDKLPMFVQSADLEVQERACCILQLMKYIQKLQDKGVKVADEVQSLFAGELNPVAPKAQRKVPVPEGLDLDAWINEPDSDSSDEEISKGNIFSNMDVSYDKHSGYHHEERKKKYEPTDEELAKMREMRRQEQEHNPHYLKGDGPTKRHGKDSNNMDEIPVNAIDLTVPLHVPALSSDKYLRAAQEAEAERRAKKAKDRKKKKRKGKRGQDEEDSDNEIPVMHAVSSSFDVPEGARLSEEDDDNMKNGDPHRALDINLDEPLRDDEQLPVLKHRIVGDVALVDNDTPVAGSERKSKKHRKEKGKDRRERDKRGKEKKDRKKDKKERKKKHQGAVSEEENEEPNLLVTTDSYEVPGESEQVDNREETPTENRETGTDEKSEKDMSAAEMEFWLSKNDAPVTGNLAGEADSPPPADTPPAPPTPEKYARVQVSDDDTPRGTEEKSKRKKKKDKKEKKQSKEKRREKKKSEYEEAEGITTPSMEQVPPSQAATPAAYKLPPMSSYKLLAENSSIKMIMETRTSLQHSKQIIASVIFTNLTSSHVRGLEFNVLDSLNTKLVRGPGRAPHEPVKVPFILLPDGQNESQFAFTVENISMPQKLKGTLTYFLKTEEGSTADKLDFKLCLPCTSCLVGLPCNGDAFAKLLGSGDLSEKYSTQFKTVDIDFGPILAKICFFGHFSIVEQVDISASLYSKSIQGHDVCLLVKQMPNGTLSIDGKSTDHTFLSNVVDDIKAFLVE